MATIPNTTSPSMPLPPTTAGGADRRDFPLSITVTRAELFSTSAKAETEEEAVRKVREVMGQFTDGTFGDVTRLTLGDGQTVEINYVDELKDSFRVSGA